MEDYAFFIQKTLDLANGKVSPNPRVGSLITDSNGRILSEGFHAFYGAVHAEVDALNKLPLGHLSSATLYCNLEPCSHNSPGKINPPCAPQIIASGIKKVVIGMVLFLSRSIWQGYFNAKKCWY